MCELCAATTVFDPQRHPLADHLRIAGAEIFESADAPDRLETLYRLPVGGSFHGTLARPGDRDYIAVTLEADSSYQISQYGYWGGGGTLQDGTLSVYDAAGHLIARNDDGTHGYDAEINLTVSVSGTYFIAVGSYRDSLTGTYRLSVDTDAGAAAHVGTEASVAALADYLVDGYWEETGRDQRAFDLSQSNRIEVSLAGLTAEGQQLARWALEAWEMVANIEFVEVASGGQITFSDAAAGAYTLTDLWGATILDAELNISSNWLARNGTALNSYSMLAYLHEIGHALGLGHQGNYDSSATYGVDQTFSNDSWQMSVMSYFSQQENTSVDASYGLPITPMQADIVAIQSLYGAPSDGGVTAGDTVWGHGSEFGTYLDLAFESFLAGNAEALGSGRAFVFTIYDSGGIDTLNLSPLTAASNIDLNGGAFSDIRGRTGALAIAEGTEIENLVLGSGDDRVVGNALDNEISGNDGNDQIDGGAGRDWIWGGAGQDTIAGGDDRDILFGNSGEDHLLGGGGDDLLVGQRNDDTLDGGDGDDVLSGGHGADSFCLRVGGGHDRIKDFEAGDGDVLLLERGLVSGEIQGLQALYDQYGQVCARGVVFTFETGDTLELMGIRTLDAVGADALQWL